VYNVDISPVVIE